jgi:hypothetical protein
MKWDYEHDEICCKTYIEKIIIKHSENAKACINLARNRGVPHDNSSVKMKFQNIKSICDDEGIKHSSPFTGLANYSQQNKLAFDNVRKLYNL